MGMSGETDEEKVLKGKKLLDFLGFFPVAVEILEWLDIKKREQLCKKCIMLITLSIDLV